MRGFSAHRLLAVIALTANVAIKKSMRGESGYMSFDEAWFDIDNDATPDGSSVAEQTSGLLKKS